MGVMDRGLRERVRWGNVARALAVVMVVGLVVTWPRLAPEAPAVPDAAVVPVVTVPPAAAAPPGRVAPGRVAPRRVAPRRVAPRRVAPPVVRKRKRVGVRGERRAGEGGGGSWPRRRERRVMVAPTRP